MLGEAGKIVTPPWCEALQPAKLFLSFLPALCPCLGSQSRRARSEDGGRATGTVPAAVTTFAAVGTSLLKRLQDHEVRRGGVGLRAPLHAPGFPRCRGRGASHLRAPLPSCRHFVPERGSCRSSWTNATAPRSFPRSSQCRGSCLCEEQRCAPRCRVLVASPPRGMVSLPCLRLCHGPFGSLKLTGQHTLCFKLYFMSFMFYTLQLGGLVYAISIS